VDINRAWRSTKDNMEASATESLGYYELKEHKPCLDEECSKLLDQRKQAKLQRLQNPSQTYGHDLNNVIFEINLQEQKEGISEIKKQ